MMKKSTWVQLFVLVAGMVMLSSGMVWAENLIVNPGFSNPSSAGVPEGWRFSPAKGSENKILPQTAPSQGSGNAVTLTSTLDQGRGSIYQTFPISGGKRYRFSVDFKSNLVAPANSPFPMHTTMRVQTFKEKMVAADHVKLEYDSVLSDLTTTVAEILNGVVYVWGPDQQKEWDTLTLELKAPDNVSLAVFELFLWAAQGELAFRNPKCELLP